MTKTFQWRKAGLVAALAVSASLVGLTPASAATPPPWQSPTPTDPNNTGTLSFYGPTGTAATTGCSNLPVASFVQAAGLTATSGKATLFAYSPQHATNPGAWTGSQLSAATTFPVTSPPGSVSATAPVVTEAATDGTVGSFLASHTSDTTAGYTKVVEVRVLTSGPNGFDTHYASADLQLDTTAGTWTEIYPTAATLSPACLSLTGSSSGSQPTGTTETLTATLTTTAIAGTVQFFDNGTAIGTAQAITGTSASTATLSVSPAPALGNHSYTAIYTPAVAGTYDVSPPSAPVVLAIGTHTTTTIAASPQGPVSNQTPVTLTSTVSPSTAPGTVQLKDNGANVGDPVPVSSGTATQTITPGVGSHVFTATFLPTDTGSYYGSTSTAVGVTEAPPASTSTTLALSVPSPVVSGTVETLTSTTTPAVPGTVQFLDGTTPLGAPVAVTSGKAVVGPSAAAVGPHSFTAVFTPTSTTSTGSTSAAVPLTVTKANATATISVTPSVAFGKPATATITIAAPGQVATGAVTVTSGTTVLGTAPLVGGRTTLSIDTAKLKTGTVTLSVAYSGDGNINAGSATTTLTITKGSATGKVSLAKSTVSAKSKAKIAVSFTGSGFVPTGKVQAIQTITKGKKKTTKVLASATLNKSGKATITLPKLKDGTYKLTITYVGSSNLSSTSKSVTLKVKN